jgi:hypothetical protein
MAWTAPATYVAGQTLTAAQLNTQLRDNLLFVATAKAVSLERTSVLSVGHNSWTSVAWQVAEFETVEAWSASTNPDRITPQLAGYWLVTFKTWFAGAAGGLRAGRVVLNGTTTLHSDKREASSAPHTLPSYTHGLVHLNGTTDYLTCQAYQDTGSALDLTITPGEATSVSLAWLGF